MKLTYEAPALEYYGKVAALTSSFKCTQGVDTFAAAPANTHHGTEQGGHGDDGYSPDDSDGCRLVDVGDFPSG